MSIRERNFWPGDTESFLTIVELDGVVEVYTSPRATWNDTKQDGGKYWRNRDQYDRPAGMPR